MQINVTLKWNGKYFVDFLYSNFKKSSRIYILVEHVNVRFIMLWHDVI